MSKSSSHFSGTVVQKSPPCIKVGMISGVDRRGCCLSGRDRHSNSSLLNESRMKFAFSIEFTAPPTVQLGCACSACPDLPCTLILSHINPLVAVQSPRLEGSGMTAALAL